MFILINLEKNELFVPSKNGTRIPTTKTDVNMYHHLNLNCLIYSILDNKLKTIKKGIDKIAELFNSIISLHFNN